MLLQKIGLALSTIAASLMLSTSAFAAAADPLVGVWKGTMVVLAEPESHVVPDVTIAFDGKMLHLVQDGKRSSKLYVFDTEKRTLQCRDGTFKVWLKNDKLTLLLDEDDPSVPSKIRHIWSLTRQPTLDELKKIPEAAVFGVERAD